MLTNIYVAIWRHQATMRQHGCTIIWAYEAWPMCFNQHTKKISGIGKKIKWHLEKCDKDRNEQDDNDGTDIDDVDKNDMDCFFENVWNLLSFLCCDILVATAAISSEHNFPTDYISFVTNCSRWLQERLQYKENSHWRSVPYRCFHHSRYCCITHPSNTFNHTRHEQRVLKPYKNTKLITTAWLVHEICHFILMLRPI